MEALMVTAHLSHGYVAADDWSPSLDGILAYWQLRELLGEEEFALGMSGQRELVPSSLPLERIEGAGTWWWACSAPAPGPLAATFERHIHRRFDDQYDRYMPAGVGRVETAAGPYKAYRNRRLTRLVPWVRWHVVGDEAEVRRLLLRCTSIGQGTGHGWGDVREWEFGPGDASVARLRRPLPVAYATEHGVMGIRMRWGIRPPGRLPEHQVDCVMPG